MVRRFNDQTQGARWVNNAKFGGKCVNSSLGAVLTWP